MRRVLDRDNVKLEAASARTRSKDTKKARGDNPIRAVVGTVLATFRSRRTTSDLVESVGGYLADDPSRLNLPRQVQLELQRLDASDHWKNYANYRQQLHAAVLAELPEIEKRVEPEKQAAEEVFRAGSSLRLRPWGAAVASALLATVLGAVVLYVADLDIRNLSTDPFASVRVQRLVWIGCLIVGAPAGFYAVVTLRGEAASAEAILSRARRARDAYGLNVAVAVEEAYTRAVNSQLGPQGIVVFPQSAPRLVELSTSTVVPSKTLQYVRAFIAGHESSAVGIAGPRGSGKSTVMAALMSDVTLVDGSVLMTAPVRYASLDFLRQLFIRVAEDVDARSGGWAHKEEMRRGRRLRRARLHAALAAVYAGSIMFALDGFLPAFDFLRDIGPLGTLGGLIAVFGVSLLTYVLTQSRMIPSDTSIGLQGRLAAEALRSSRYDIEHGRTSKNVFKPIGGLLELEDEEALTLRRRTATQADLVSELRQLLGSVASAEGGGRYLIAIDELDKISSTQDLVDVINDLKDLFHIPGVHFLVSVSLEALASFEQRGLPSRDAFDSSFDTIVGMDELTVHESLKVLASRVEGFPPMLGLFCHAWSGGLPRDLLRCARRCVEIHNASPELVPLTRVMSSLIAEDLSAVIASLVRSGTHELDVESLMLLRRSLWRLIDAPAEDMPVASWHGRPPRVAYQTAMLGQALLRIIRHRVKGSSWQTPDADLERVAELVAAAMASRGDVEAFQAEAWSEAHGACCALLASSGSARVEQCS
jgi:hypothetical protein